MKVECEETQKVNNSKVYQILPNSQGQVNKNICRTFTTIECPFSIGIPGGPVYCRLKLTKLVLPRFKGKITNYRTFWDSFDNAVHKNPGLSKIDKFNYLNSLLEGRALRAIQGLTVTEDNYDAAVEILQQRFGKTQQTICAHMDELMKIPACNSTDKPSQLRYIYDKISVHTRGLASLGVDSKQYGSLLIPMIMAKLPLEVRIQIARTTKKEIWDIPEILDAILHEVEAREVSENVKINSEPRKPPANKYPSSAASSLLAQEAKPSTRSIRCAYCNDSHYSASCEKVLDINTRKQMLKRDNRCFVCLGKITEPINANQQKAAGGAVENTTSQFAPHRNSYPAQRMTHHRHLNPPPIHPNRMLSKSRVPKPPLL